MLQVTKVSSPLKVFISSISDGKYKEIRQTIFNKLNISPLVQPFLYERESASSIHSREYYTIEIQRSDLFVCIIDNFDEISDSVYDEVQKAEKFGIPTLYFFCSEFSENETYLQKELNGEKNPKYCVVEKFNDIPKRVEEAINSDIVQRYRLKHFQSESNLLDSEVRISNDINYHITKNSIITNIISNFIMQNIGMKIESDVDKTDFENKLLNIFRITINLEKFDIEKFENIFDELLNFHSMEIKEIIKIRFNSLKSYLKGDYKETIKLLTTALSSSAQDINIPVWLANNIAVDLRNVLNEYNNLNNSWKLDNRGQNFINERKEDLHFPILDRKEKLLQEKLNKIYFGSLNRVTEFNIQNMGIFEYLQEIFLLALFYGSITNLSIFIDDLINTLNILNKVSPEYNIQKELIRLLIVKGNKKELENNIKYRTDENLFISENDFFELIQSIENISHPYYNLKSKLLFMTEFSDYLDKENFDVEVLDLNGRIIRWLKEDNPTLNLESYVFNYLKKISFRIDSKLFLPLIDTVFRNKLRRFYRSTFELMELLNFSNCSESEQARIYTFIVNILEEENVNPYDKIGNAIINFCKTTSIETRYLIQILKSNFKQFYENYFLLELKHKEYGVKFVSMLLDKIHHDNLEQGINGVYFYGSNHYGTIMNIIRFDKLEFSSELQKKAFLVCLETISSKTQKLEEKIHAVELLILLFLNNEINIELTDKVISDLKKINIDSVENNRDVFFSNGNSKLVLKLSIFLLLSIFEKSYTQKVIDQLLMYRTDEENELYRSFEILILFIQNIDTNNIESKLLVAITYFATFSLKSKSINIQSISTFCLINLTRFPSVNELSLNQISIKWENSTSEIKLGILSNFEKIVSSSEYKKFLLLKAKKDNHYLVKEKANIEIERMN
ncbi:DUF4062 domain-containing protein [Streptococcus parauberis]|uniref:DUF4062 domain-containing protein n=1 Tax=Streptococcus parauberis TaxID=1348 RepID=UPI003789EC03